MEKFINGVANDVADEILTEINQRISDSANEIVGNAIDRIATYLPTNSSKKDFLAKMQEIKAEGIEAAINGDDYKKYLERGAYETSVYLANHYADAALKRAANEFPNGKTKDAIFSALQEMSVQGIESFCSGKSLDVIKQQLSSIGKAHFQKYVENQSKIWSKNIGNSLYRKIKFSGKGSRKKNQHLRAGRDILTAELTFQITDNLGAFLGGDKNFSQAVTDLTVNTVKNSAVKYTKKQGAEIAVDALKTLSKSAEKDIVKGLVSNGLKKLSNANTLMNVAGTAYEIGKALKQLMNGEITKAEFLRIVGEKGTAVVVSGVYATMGGGIGMFIGGPLGATIGAAVGSAVGYFATSVLFSSVLQAFDEAEMSRKHYEAVHEFCEYSIREMERQRLEFEAKVKEFLSDRQQVIDTSLDDYERAIKSKDMDAMSSALNDIAEEFGGELQFKTKKEFVKFMNDKNSVFEL